MSDATEMVTEVFPEIAFQLELLKRRAEQESKQSSKVALGQYFTPWPIAALMASMLDCKREALRLLDPGAGVGSLTAAVVYETCARTVKPASIHVTAVEIDSRLLQYLETTLELCKKRCEEVGIAFEAEIIEGDFLEWAMQMDRSSLFSGSLEHRFDTVIMNPPYRKIPSDSHARRLLRILGVETGNLYTGFLAAAIKLLDENGELVAITPRSFCNGTYFTPFRRFLLSTTKLRRIHTFESRKLAFQDDDVLQENIILHSEKEETSPKTVLISKSLGSNEISEIAQVGSHEVPYEEVVRPHDRQAFIHLVLNETELTIRHHIHKFSHSLRGIGIHVSTGRVVDFRSREHLRAQPSASSVPLIYPSHLERGIVKWPKQGIRKPNAIEVNNNTKEMLVSNGYYVLVKRFSSKEERRRIVAALYNPTTYSGNLVAFENHLNYFHANGIGLDENLARGLTIYLNSTLVDSYFRQFNGHTQVNAGDLKSLPYPSRIALEALGQKMVGPISLSQDSIDSLIMEL